MSLFGLLKRPDINAGVKTARAEKGAVILDVRTRQEYMQERIPGSVNIPLDGLGKISEKIPDKSTPVFVHCLSGARSSTAAKILKNAGYTNVTDIGGISNYRGKTERG